jgi:(p)ppGpp synthase/HD superfamily hydrolase
MNNKVLDNNQVLQLAIELHSGQKRSNGLDYITHPIAVARIASDLLDLCFPILKDRLKDSVIQAAYLHDVLEDCPITEQGLIDQGIDKDVVEICRILNKNNYFSYCDYILNIIENEGSVALIVKYADLLHNSHNQKNKLKRDRYDLAIALIHTKYYIFDTHKALIRNIVNKVTEGIQ